MDKLELHTFEPSLMKPGGVVVDLGATKTTDGDFSGSFAEKGFNVYAVEENEARAREISKKAKVIIKHIGEGYSFNDLIREYDINEIELLKVDIEGSEIQLFGDMSKDLIKSSKQITIEFHDFLYKNTAEFEPRVAEIKSVIRKIKEAGFYYIPISVRSYADMFFVRKDLISKIKYLKMRYLERWLLVKRVS